MNKEFEEVAQPAEGDIILTYTSAQECINQGTFCMEEVMENNRGVVALSNTFGETLVDAYASVEEYEAFIAELEATLSEGNIDFDEVEPEDFIVQIMERNLVKVEDYR